MDEGIDVNVIKRLNKFPTPVSDISSLVSNSVYLYERIYLLTTILRFIVSYLQLVS